MQILLRADQRENDSPFLIAIDGHSAAGKSTLARKLAGELGQTAVVFTDDFYRPINAEKRFRLTAQEGYVLYYDWQRLRSEVLQPLIASQAAKFGVYDWENNEVNGRKRVEPTRFVIVEGCYSARPKLSSYFDFVILVETSPQERQRRQAERNDASQAWLDRWDAAERFYIETTSLWQRADLIMTGMG